MRPKSFLKSMREQDKFHGRKSDAKDKEIINQWCQKQKQKPLKSNQKQFPKLNENMQQKLIQTGGAMPPRNTSDFKDNSSEDNLPKENTKFRQEKRQQP